MHPGHCNHTLSTPSSKLCPFTPLARVARTVKFRLKPSLTLRKLVNFNKSKFHKNGNKIDLNIFKVLMFLTFLLLLIKG